MSTAKHTKAANPRIAWPDPLLIKLCAQVGQVCPLCGKPLFIKKNNKNYKDYEIAHIYPLNPTEAELKLLKNELRLSVDPNDEKNLIPLCFTCHKIYDTGKTLESYRDLYEIKKRLLDQELQLAIRHDFKIETDISLVISALMNETTLATTDESYTVKRVDEKLCGDILPLTKRRIKNDVSSFYTFIRDQLAEIEKTTPSGAVLIAQQVKAFYLKQKTYGLSQQDIYQNTVGWIASKSPPGAGDAAAAIAAFFVQNCELFE